MKNTFTNIDELILNKSFSELTPDELHSLKDVATDESAFNQIKATLFAIQKEMISSEEITPRESSKTALLAEFNKARPALNATNTSHIMGWGYFFPKGKSVIQMPGIQILSVAACILLIVTLFDFSSSNFQSSEQAYLETKQTNKEAETTKEPMTNTSQGGEKSLSKETEMADNIEKDQKEFTTEKPVTIVTNIEVDKAPHSKYDNYTMVDNILDEVAMEKSEGSSGDILSNTTEQELFEIEEVVIVENKFAATSTDADQMDGLSGSSQSGSIQTSSVNSKTTSLSANSPVRESSASLAYHSLLKKEAKKSKATEMVSRTLADDAKLIELFYTAM